MDVTWINENLMGSRGLVSKRCTESWFRKNGFGEKLFDLLDKTSFLDGYDVKLSERLWYIYNEKNELVECGYIKCSNKPDLQSFSMGYLNYCCNSHAQKSKKVRERIKKTNKQRYGTEHPLQNSKILKKQKKTVREKYGVDNVSQLNWVNEKKKETCLKNYGVEWILENNDLKRQRMIEKYGVDNSSKREKIKEQYSRNRRKSFAKKLISGNRLNDEVEPNFNVSDWMGVDIEHPFKCKRCGDIFESRVRSDRKVRCPNCYPSQNTSKAEKEIYYFVDELLDCEVNENVWDVIENQELDIYIPEKQIAIEYDGLYYHSEINGGKDRNYHINKTEKCYERGIQLIHIFEDEWLYKQDIVKQKLKHLLNVSDQDRVYARNCEVREIDPSVKNEFLRKNHLQGEDKSNIKLGLFNNDKLVAVMTFSRPRIALGADSTEDEYEISRYASSEIVVGGAGKLFAYFKRNYKFDQVYSYADLRWSSLDGSFYEKLGFEFDSKTDPNYWYIDNAIRYHRFNFRKNVLSEKLDEYDSDLTEWQNMQLSGFDRIWDCGHMKYVYQK